VLQERLLSPRTVHLHANEMVWACDVIERCECKGLTEKLDYSVMNARKDQILKLDKMNLKEIYGFWRTLVQDANRLNLTYESDRLTSLSGLASRIAKYLPQNERYLAGLWEGDLARNLLWASDHKALEKKSTAPSWSWASLEWGDNNFADKFQWEHESIPKHVELSASSGAKTYTQDPRTRIISASVNINEQNKYGMVQGGSIVIEGPLCVELPQEYFPWQSKPPWSNFTTIVSTPSAELYDTDIEMESESLDFIYYLFIGTFNTVPEHHGPLIQHQGLILKQNDEGKFERLGLWQSGEDDDDPRRWGVQRVEIV
jgi:hypothetical protein